MTTKPSETPEIDIARCHSCGQEMRPTDYLESLRSRLRKTERIAGEQYTVLLQRAERAEARIATLEHDLARTMYIAAQECDDRVKAEAALAKSRSGRPLCEADCQREQCHVKGSCAFKYTQREAMNRELVDEEE